MAKDAICGYIESLKKHKEPIPTDDETLVAFPLWRTDVSLGFSRQPTSASGSAVARHGLSASQPRALDDDSSRGLEREIRSVEEPVMDELPFGALRESVGPIKSRTSATVFSPDKASAMTGPDCMKDLSPG